MLRLPGEIRNEVYSYVLYRDPWISIGCLKVPDSTTSKSGRKSVLALLATCRAIYSEARLLPFSLNEFYFKVLNNGFLLFCLELGTKRRGAMEEVFITGELTIVHWMVKATRNFGFQSLSEVFPNSQSVGTYIYNHTLPLEPRVKEMDEEITGWVPGGL